MAVGIAVEMTRVSSSDYWSSHSSALELAGETWSSGHFDAYKVEKSTVGAVVVLDGHKASCGPDSWANIEDSHTWDLSATVEEVARRESVHVDRALAVKRWMLVSWTGGYDRLAGMVSAAYVR